MFKKFSLVALFFCFSVNLAIASELEVKNFINDLGNNIIDVANDEKLTLDNKRDQLTEIIDGVIDADWISKFVLGKNFRRATTEQKEEFRVLYREFMINNYSPKFTGYNGEKFTIDAIISNGNYFTVKCLFILKDDAPSISLDFRVRENTKNTNSNKFLVFDIIAEGISLIETQRSEFGSVISRDGMEKFLKDLRIKNQNLKNKKNNG
ncbi:MAG: phospholipid transport system substrate-binding protein [Lentimonas sp.]|jgi:phospholipid transport system substrate-binding protein